MSMSDDDERQKNERRSEKTKKEATALFGFSLTRASSPRVRSDITS